MITDLQFILLLSEFFFKQVLLSDDLVQFSLLDQLLLQRSSLAVQFSFKNFLLAKLFRKPFTLKSEENQQITNKQGSDMEIKLELRRNSINLHDCGVENLDGSQRMLVV